MLKSMVVMIMLVRGEGCGTASKLAAGTRILRGSQGYEILVFRFI